MSDLSAVHIVSEVFFPDTTSTGYFLTEIARDLAPQFRVRVYCAKPVGVSVRRCDSIDWMAIRRFGRMSNPSCGVFRRAVSALARVLRLGIGLLTSAHAGDVLLTVTNPPFAPIVMAAVSYLTGAKLVVLVHDVYPDAATIAGLIKSGTVAELFLGNLQRWTLRRAVNVVCLGRDMRALLAAQDPRIASRLVIIPNWSERPKGDPRHLTKTSSQFGAKIGAQGSFTVLHAGNLGKTHDSQVIAESVRLLSRENGIVVALALARKLPEELQRMIEAGGYPLCAAAMSPSRDGQWDTLAAADVVLIVFKAGMSGVSVPSRMYNAFAAGKPIIAVTDPCSELAQVINEEQVGWVIPPGRSDLLAQAIVRARDGSITAMSARALRLADSRFSKEASMVEYRRLIVSVLRCDPDISAVII